MLLEEWRRWVGGLLECVYLISGVDGRGVNHRLFLGETANICLFFYTILKIEIPNYTKYIKRTHKARKDIYRQKCQPRKSSFLIARPSHSPRTPSQQSTRPTPPNTSALAFQIIMSGPSPSLSLHGISSFISPMMDCRESTWRLWSGYQEKPCF